MTGHVTKLRQAAPRTLADRIAAARRHLFVGRETELEYFDRFLGVEHDPPLWFIVGPGGIGKSTLARALYDRATERGIPAAYLDARRIRPNPPEARHALEHAMGGRTLTEFATGSPVALLIVDTFEAWEALRPWLRDEFLPAAPANLRIVFCGRLGPDLPWRTDQGWRAVMRISQLGALSADACRDYLSRRGVEQGDRDALIEFADGHPLALAMAADAALAGRSLRGSDDTDGDVISLLVESFTREAHCDVQRQALDACAIVRELNEGLLARMLDRDDVADLFEWLRGLAFVESGENGIYPHDLVREVLVRDMPRRAPGRYEAYARAAVHWIVDRIEAAEALTWADAARMGADAAYVLRALPVVDDVFKASGAHALYLDGADDEDWDTLYDMTLRHEGAESARWFDFWRRRFPECVYVIRNPQRVARAYFLKLDMEALPADGRERDPLARKLWRFLCDDMGLHPGDHVPFIRHWVTADYALTQSPEKTQILMAINAYNLMAKNLRCTAQVFVDNPVWVALARTLGIRPVPDSETRIGDRLWRIYYLDWHQESPPRYYRRFAERIIGFQQNLEGEPVPEPAARPLDGRDFAAAVTRALKHFHTPAKLADNPLLGARLVQSELDRGADEEARIRVLRERIEAAVAAIAETGGRGERHRQVLRRAYLAPARSQKAAAAALNMGYSTFRRQLGEARAAVADEMWRWERSHR